MLGIVTMLGTIDPARIRYPSGNHVVRRMAMRKGMKSNSIVYAIVLQAPASPDLNTKPPGARKKNHLDYIATLTWK
jgi:hypothetical protein